MPPDQILSRIVPVLAEVPGVAAVVLGGSRARGTANDASDYDIGLYFSTVQPLDTGRLLEVAKAFADAADTVEVTPVGGWGTWIVGGAWLGVDGHKVDLLYRNLDDVARVIEACRGGEIAMHYQAGHPHGFCSAIWMGEVALSRPLHDPGKMLAGLKAKTALYPAPLRKALIERFQWEILFAIENAELCVARGEQTHIAGCVYRALACLAQVLFALNERYLINEKGALQEAATFPRTIPKLPARVDAIWRAIGETEVAAALASMRTIERDLKALS
ncbi:MAG TPA: nucleotidyltransferase domain-containing protein [Bradyrhizobium sp.]|uniref:nucleotidyltransferase domain-containing protein n=1 Tax=Bradyrhizobium sp. TaxID=376 RepID=UPI002C1CAA7C|nr:nucleotidyltransferase domain-containing protein [Bradyrhizobium sp.]HLZ01914.1 nucleotidyltransferase domain-containing protein [Bradyrhizobium sp.]